MEPAMPSLTIKGIPAELLEQLRRRAGLHRRSLNSEVLHLLERSIASTRIGPVERLERIHRLQERAPLPALSDEFLDEAIGEDRP
jgi:plasmid stability protein